MAEYIDIKDIWEKTDNGRLIIEWKYPESAKAFAEGTPKPRRKFKARGEKTPSASVLRGDDGIWYCTDFGEDQKSKNGIQIVMLEENCDFQTALKLIAIQFNVLSQEQRKEIFKPEIETREAAPDEQDGKYYFERKENGFSETELKTIVSPKIWEYLLRMPTAKTHANPTEVVVKECNRIFKLYDFFSLKSYTIIKDRRAIKLSSTDVFPIFYFDQTDWQKIYKPKEPDAALRFMHYNGRPTSFIFGYSVAAKASAELTKVEDDSEQFEDEEAEKHSKEKGKKKPKKLKHIFMCSGGSDGLNLALLGQAFKGDSSAALADKYYPIWLNSETAKLSRFEYGNIAKICESVYNIPDIDTTGKRAAHELALEYLDLKTIWLPEELKESSDGFRGKPQKDLRDYFKKFTPYDFEYLIKTAYPYRFWDKKPQFNKQGEFTGESFEVNNKYMINFLARNGFFRYQTESEKDGYFYIHIQNNIVTRVDSKKVRDYINSFIEKRNPEVNLMNLFLRTTQLGESSLSNLPYITIDFTDFDRDTQWLFFQNRTVKVTKDGIEDFRNGKADKFVWEEEVINHQFKLLPDFFKITLDEVNGKHDIDLKNQDCLVLRYLINTSRIYWREELERRMDGITESEREEYKAKYKFTKEDLPLLDGLSKEEADAYREKYKFSITGSLLTEAEKSEQRHHLINKLYQIGFIFHRYKQASRAWATWSMDAKLSDGDESHGGSGKSLLPNLIFQHKLMKTEYREGRPIKLTDNPHLFENTTEHTDMFLVDDANRYLKFDAFFSAITGPTMVNPKNAKQYTIPFSKSPKFWFTSNYPPHNIDPSMERRILYTIFSDYYHHNKMDEYREARTVRDDFGKDLGEDFTPEEWNLFLNLIAQCIRFYLSAPIKLNPPMENVNARNLKSAMGEAFQPWADVFFSAESGRLDTFVIKSVALNDFLKATNMKWTTQKFTTAIKAWCQYNNYELDPKEHQNARNRIIKRVKMPGDIDGVEKAAEMLYIRTTHKANVLAEAAGAIAEEKQNPDDIPF